MNCLAICFGVVSFTPEITKPVENISIHYVKKIGLHIKGYINVLTMQYMNNVCSMYDISFSFEMYKSGVHLVAIFVTL